MTALNSEGLKKAVAQAIFDPGATEGYKGDRTLTEWQVQAVMRAITSHTPALPPVDGLEVVGYRYRFSNWGEGSFNLHAVTPVGAEVCEPLVTLSQASSVIAGLTAERDEAVDRAKVWEHYWSQEVKVKSEVVSWAKEAMDKADAAEARISSLEEENKRLSEALEGVMKEETFSFHVGYDNATGGGNFVYADVIRTDSDAFLAARRALEDHNG